MNAEPLDLGAQRIISRLTNEVEGRAAVVLYLRQLVARFPHHQGVNELLVEWLDEAPLGEQEDALQRLLEISPVNAWARRQLALTLAKQRRFDEARDQANLAHELAPDAVTTHTTRGHIESLAGRLPEARAAFRDALRHSVDSDYALGELIGACGSLEDRRIELTFVLDEMKRQVIVGESLLTFQRLARTTFEPAALTTILDEARNIRPDLWETWVACARQGIERQDYEAARLICQKALEKFPLLPRLHVELAEAARLSGDRHAERDALREALHLNPAWGYAARQLVDSLEADGDFVQSRTVLEKALRHSPADAFLHGYLGHTLWQLNEREAAVKHLQQGVGLNLGYEWAWSTLKERSTTLGQPDMAPDLARSIAAQRPGDVRCWMAVARMTDDREEKLAALDRAIQLAPLSVDPHIMKLDLLIELARFDDALTALRTTAWGEHPPVALRAKEPKALAGRGETEMAILRLQEVLADDPNYSAGWQQLADWQSECEDYPAYLIAAQELHRIAPDDAYALGYLADALSKADPKTDVRPYLRRALHLKADYAFAANWLFDLEFDAGALDAAEAVLGKLMTHVDTATSHLRALRLAIRRGQRESALNRFRQLWTLSDEESEVFREAMTVLDEAGWGREANEVLEQVVHVSQTNPHAGTVWIERRARPTFAIRRFRGLANVFANGEVGQQAAQALLQHLATKQDTKALRRVLHDEGSHLRASETTHGVVSSALLRASAPQDVIEWFGDWEKRGKNTAWALLNLACALRYVRRGLEAHKVHCHAVTLNEDHSFPEHRVWLAIDAARKGNYSDNDSLPVGAKVVTAACNQDDPLYGNGEYQRVIQEHLTAALHGNECARKFVVSMYTYGYGPDKAEAESLGWYATAAKGNAHYAKEQYAEALTWYQRSAVEGNVAALQMIGELYEKGKGVDPNPIKAYLFYKEAVRYGHLPAKGGLARLLFWGQYGIRGIVRGLALNREKGRESAQLNTLFLT